MLEVASNYLNRITGMRPARKYNIRSFSNNAEMQEQQVFALRRTVTLRFSLPLSAMTMRCLYIRYCTDRYRNRQAYTAFLAPRRLLLPKTCQCSCDFDKRIPH